MTNAVERNSICRKDGLYGWALPKCLGILIYQNLVIIRLVKKFQILSEKDYTLIFLNLKFNSKFF